MGQMLTENIAVVLLVLSGIFINILIKIKTLRTPIDFDTANHLYFAFLHKHKIKFNSSYNIGIKFFLPRIYALTSGFISKNDFNFRYINILSSSLLIIIWGISIETISIKVLLFFALGVLLINSMTINFTTSASEFHEAVLLLVLFLLPDYFEFYYSWCLQLIILAILIIGAKFLNAVYIIPVISMYYQYLNDYLIVLSLGTLFIISVTIYTFLKVYKSSKSYSTTRKFFNSKSVNYIKSNPFFVTLLFTMSGFNIVFSEFFLSITLIVTLLIFLAQKSYLSYFYYPLIAINVFLIFKNHNVNLISNIILYIVIINILIIHILKIVIKSPLMLDVYYRQKILGQNTDWKGFLAIRDSQVKWLTSNIKQNETVYLWGSNVPLLLLSKLIHLPDTYYSHNHLFYWSTIRDKKKYIANLIINRQPKYIIQSMILNNSIFPIENTELDYHLIEKIGDMYVYKKIEIK